MNISPCLLWFIHAIPVYTLLPPPLIPPGSNSTGTPGLRTAAVVISYLGAGIVSLALILLSCLVCKQRGCISRAKKWLAEARKNKQKTKG